MRSLERLNGDLRDRGVSRTIKMLIVDDEPNVCFTLKMIFEQEGYAVASAGSAAEGIRVLAGREHYDIVITDLHMEREDAGFDLVRAAKKLVPPPIVIVVTGYASVKNARAALDVHVDHFAIKPIEITEFLEAVRRLAGWRTDVHHAGS
jgi:two-component system response regulator YesN